MCSGPLRHLTDMIIVRSVITYDNTAKYCKIIFIIIMYTILLLYINNMPGAHVIYTVHVGIRIDHA